MKKVKIMLLSLALFAVVGGALAFKAKFQTDFCTTKTILVGGQPACPVSPAACPLFEDITTIDPGETGVRFCYTTTNNNPLAPCQNVLNCTSKTTFKNDQ